jgi:uncharacterized membrane protein (DUF485 family)
VLYRAFAILASVAKPATGTGVGPSLTAAIVPIGIGLFLIMLIGGGAFFYRRRGDF